MQQFAVKKTIVVKSFTTVVIIKNGLNTKIAFSHFR